MNRLDEQKIIKLFQNQFGNKKFVSEDVETFKIGKNSFAITIDTLVESTDVPPGVKLEDTARKSIVSCVSDFSAKGVKPLYGIISITIPRRFTQSKIKALTKGISKASKEFNIKILGGDTNEGKELVLQVVLIGTSKKIILRKGAKKNDRIITTGPFGYSALGLKILLEKKKINTKFAKKAVKYFSKPSPKLQFCLTNKDYFTSSMDSSDGLSSTLHEMARQSKKKFVITKMPTQPELLHFVKKNKMKLIDLVFNGGEEYQTISTVSPSDIQKIQINAKKQKIPLYEIGYVTDGSGVILQSKGKTLRIPNNGWIHFRS